MNDENVIKLTGKRAPVTQSADTPATQIDEQAIRILEELLVEFKSGKYRGVLVAVGIADTDPPRDAITFASDYLLDNPLAAFGAASLVKQHVVLAFTPQYVTTGADPEEPTG